MVVSDAPLRLRLVELAAASPHAIAKAAGLRYVSDTTPGIRRARTRSGFIYHDRDGEPITDEEVLGRIKGLAIPPAWEDVWISPYENGHTQATGRDARGRKQYRYHARWREIRDDVKFDRMVDFGLALPRIREQTDADLGRTGLPREKVLAAVVRLLETTLIRVGNEEYARENKSFGLTTLRGHHVDVNGTTMRFRFRGKSGKQHEVGIRNRRLARIIRQLQDLPGQELFQYVDDNGQMQTIGSADVNAYLREISGQDFTAKDFRTWAATVLAALLLREFDAGESDSQAKRNVARAVELVAARLGNTPAICRKSYVHPVVIEAYLEGGLSDLHAPADEASATASSGLEPDEAAVLELLRRSNGRAQTPPKPSAKTSRERVAT